MKFTLKASMSVSDGKLLSKSSTTYVLTSKAELRALLAELDRRDWESPCFRDSIIPQLQAKLKETPFTPLTIELKKERA